jgi:hypothetical protein
MMQNSYRNKLAAISSKITIKYEERKKTKTNLSKVKDLKPSPLKKKMSMQKSISIAENSSKSASKQTPKLIEQYKMTTSNVMNNTKS